MSTHVLARLSAQRRWVRRSCVLDRLEIIDTGPGRRRYSAARHTLESDYFDALTLVRRGF